MSGPGDGDPLARLRSRIDAVTRAPGEAAGRWSRLVSPLFRLVGWQAKFGTDRLEALLAGLAGDDVKKLADRAIAELDDNLDVAERACAVRGYVPTAHASWLYRVHDVLHKVRSLAENPEPAAKRALAGLDGARVLPPLRLADRTTAERARPATERGERLLELQLAAIDHIVDAARSETRFLERRRRLLEGARRLLLDAGAALRLDAAGESARHRHIASEITRIDRLEAAGISPTIAVDYQAKQALRRGDRDKLYAALVAMDGFALRLGDAGTAARTGKALEGLAGSPAGPDAGLAWRRAAGRSAEEMFGEDVVRMIRRQYASAREGHGAADADPELSRLALEYLAPGSEDAAFAALVSVDGAFEVGASLSPVRVRELVEVARVVQHPTRELLVVPATDPRDLPHAVIEDPRTVLLDLAAGRLLARKYVQREKRPVDRIRLVGEVRVYVLDASTSMLEGSNGARARVRDAILLAELATTMRRLQDRWRSARLTLYYRFFTKRLGELERVATAEEALAAMAAVVGTMRKGGTDIEAALLSSFELIRDAKRTDPDLARAGIVLVTDGEAPVDPELVRKAREEAGDVAVSVSVIALGEENPVLRDLVARQRARGERAFYRFMGDAELEAMCRGELGAGRPIHLPRSAPTRADVTREVEDVLLELEDLRRTKRRPVPAAEDDGLDGERALEDAAARDVASLDRRFARWFPRGAPARAPAGRGAPEHEHLDAMRIVLDTVAEVVGELGGDATHRKADAIDLVERLLPESRMTPAEYRDVLAMHAADLGEELGAVHRAVGGAAPSLEKRIAGGLRRRGILAGAGR